MGSSVICVFLVFGMFELCFVDVSESSLDRGVDAGRSNFAPLWEDVWEQSSVFFRSKIFTCVHCGAIVPLCWDCCGVNFRGFFG